MSSAFDRTPREYGGGVGLRKREFGSAVAVAGAYFSEQLQGQIAVLCRLSFCSSSTPPVQALLAPPLQLVVAAPHRAIAAAAPAANSRILP